MKRVMFTGPRDLYVSDSFIVAAIDNAGGGGFPECVVVGDASGVDHCVRNWAVRNGYVLNETLFVHRARWKEWGKQAGPRRNAQMVEDVGRGYCVAIREEGRYTRGTGDAVARAQKANLQVSGVRVLALRVSDDVRVAMDVECYER